MGFQGMLMQLTWVGVLLSGMAAAAVADQLIPRPNCTDSCGGVEIPFPFGITEEGQMDILMYVAIQCLNEMGTVPFLSLTSVSTVSNTQNVFVAVGCDTYAYFNAFTNNDYFSMGCLSRCGSKPKWSMGLALGLGVASSISPPIILNSLKDNKTLPMVLDWAIGNETCEYAQSKSDYVCGGNSTCYDLPDNATYGYRCKCKDGYDGNPYLPLGCQDINECESINACADNATCTNFPGSFSCSCNDGYQGDGKKLCSKSRGSNYVIQTALGISIGLLALVVGGSCISWALKRRKLLKLKEKFFKQNGGLMLQQQLSSHRGSVANNKVVAIKKSKISDQSQIEQFINEVIVLTQINHRNVVKLLGCCLETEVPLLVYEFITNGTLSNHIHNKSLSSSLSWEKRLKIAAETAGALAYLHSSTSMPIIHRDVKTTNILLDDNYMAKVSDFGASRLIPLDQTQLTTLVQGTFGYLDPEYFYTSQLTEKSDVYSFGVVVAELLTGKQALSFNRPESDRNLAIYFVSAIKEDRLLQILEDHIVNEGNIAELKEVANLAKKCLRANLYTEETEHLLNNSPTHSFSIDVGTGCSSTSTTTRYDSMMNQVLKPVDDGR
ncbi:hypothetical protein SLA2020_382590 [Shorea laevis]